MGNGRGAEIIKIIHRSRNVFPGPVDDQRSEKDRPPQSGGCNRMLAERAFYCAKSLSKNQRTAFAQALLCRNIPASQVCPFLVAMTKSHSENPEQLFNVSDSIKLFQPCRTSSSLCKRAFSVHHR